MPGRKRSISRSTEQEIKALRDRVHELEETLAAIRGGRIDALVIGGPSGDQVFTLQGAEHPYRVLVESINEGAATLDGKGIVLYANERLAEILGVPLDKLIGAPLQNHISPSDWYKLHALSEKGRRQPATGEITLADGDGRRRTLRLSLSPFPESDLELICAVVSEVTELVEANEAQKRSERDLQALSGRLLQLQDDERRRIARDLHDVSGQKLAALILNLSQVGRAGPLRSDASAQAVLAECRQLSEQVAEEIRTLSYVLHPPLLDEAGLASAVQWYASGFGQRAGIHVDVDIDAGLMRLPPETEIALFRVVQEALTNVRRYSGSASAQVRLRIQNDRIQLEIEDQGKGMPAEMLQSRGPSALLGVGIQGMRERMRQLSGQLEMGSGAAGGAKVVATVPIAAELREVSTPADGSADTAAGVETGGTSSLLKRILIADDHEMLREGIRQVLQTEKDWIVCGEAADGQEAIEKTLALSPDLVIVDINMPIMNGLAAMRRIRQERPQTKILVFTVNNSDQMAREIITAGADGYVCKSNASQDLIESIKTIFEAEPSSRTSPAMA
jgi:two-component system, NarL family, sensor kinase